jgi:hypothetical protein
MRDGANINICLASIERIFLQLLLIVHFCRLVFAIRQSSFMKNRSFKLVSCRNVSNKSRIGKIREVEIKKVGKVGSFL